MKLYQTNKARESAIKRIDELIEELGHNTELSYVSYLEIVHLLIGYKDIVREEMV